MSEGEEVHQEEVILEDGAEEEKTQPEPIVRPPPNIMTWLPRKEDYEVAPVIAVDETYDEKLQRLQESIEIAQNTIKEIVDGNAYDNEEKIYKTMDVQQDLKSLTTLHKDCESHSDASSHAEILKKCKVGLISLQNYLKQADVLIFSEAIYDEQQFHAGTSIGFGDWLKKAESRVIEGIKSDKPVSFDEAKEVEKKVCAFLKEVVKANKKLNQIQAAADGIKGNVTIQDCMSKLSERYFVLCKKAEYKFKTVQNLLVEWQRLDEFMEPTDPFKMDDYQTKQFVIFLRSYAAYFA